MLLTNATWLSAKGEFRDGTILIEDGVIGSLFEEADEQLDSLQKEREEYREYLVSDKAKRSGRFDVTQELNIDSLHALLDFYFPDRD